MRRALLLAVMLLLAGCYETYVRSSALAAGGPLYSDTGVSLLWGLTTSRTDAVECPYGLSSARAWQPWWGRIFVEPLTFGIITVIKKEYRCAGSPPTPGTVIMQQPQYPPQPHYAPPQQRYTPRQQQYAPSPDEDATPPPRKAKRPPTPAAEEDDEAAEQAPPAPPPPASTKKRHRRAAPAAPPPDAE